MKEMKKIIFILLLGIVVVVSGCVGQYTTTPERGIQIDVRPAIPIFSSNESINSENDAIRFVGINQESIVSKTHDYLVNNYNKFRESFPNLSYYPYPHPAAERIRIFDAGKKLFQYSKVEYREWRNDTVWVYSKDAFGVPNSDTKKHYVVAAPVVYGNYTYEDGKLFDNRLDICIAEGVALNITNLDEACSGTEKAEPYYLVYIVSIDGTVYYTDY
ncbi:MAG: hypothetical protein HZB67_02490 [Candidatus Aenigmarchaeota archaeon]|nr:hypothetical protein [Candidatus Aenigmarchaeota archaeon]